MSGKYLSVLTVILVVIAVLATFGACGGSDDENASLGRDLQTQAITDSVEREGTLTAPASTETTSAAADSTESTNAVATTSTESTNAAASTASAALSTSEITSPTVSPPTPPAGVHRTDAETNGSTRVDINGADSRIGADSSIEANSDEGADSNEETAFNEGADSGGSAVLDGGAAFNVRAAFSGGGIITGVSALTAQMREAYEETENYVYTEPLYNLPRDFKFAIKGEFL